MYRSQQNSGRRNGASSSSISSRSSSSSSGGVHARSALPGGPSFSSQASPSTPKGSVTVRDPDSTPRPRRGRVHNLTDQLQALQIPPNAGRSSEVDDSASTDSPSSRSRASASTMSGDDQTVRKNVDARRSLVLKNGNTFFPADNLDANGLQDQDKADEMLHYITFLHRNEPSLQEKKEVVKFDLRQPVLSSKTIRRRLRRFCYYVIRNYTDLPLPKAAFSERNMHEMLYLTQNNCVERYHFNCEYESTKIIGAVSTVEEGGLVDHVLKKAFPRTVEKLFPSDLKLQLFDLINQKHIIYCTDRKQPVSRTNSAASLLSLLPNNLRTRSSHSSFNSPLLDKAQANSLALFEYNEQNGIPNGHSRNLRIE